MGIKITNITKQFGSFLALKDVNIEIASGELVGLLGPSGSGKTTLLRIIAGLETPDDGTIAVNGEDNTRVHVRDRGVGFVFQHYALFRHMTIFENVAFGLRVKPRKERPTRKEIQEKVTRLLKLVQLEVVADRYPSQLSGGQRQRIALARALAVEPRILLLDEPFGALDARVRSELRQWLRQLHDQIQLTSVFVTHDQEEALEMADRIVVMNEGRVEQVGTPEEVYENPANPFILNFLGSVNLFYGRVHRGQAHFSGIAFEVPEHAATDDKPAVGYVRSQDISVERQPPDGASIRAEVRHVRSIGPIVRVTFAMNGDKETVQAELPREVFQTLALKKGDHVYVRPRNVRVFVEDGGGTRLPGRRDRLPGLA